MDKNIPKILLLGGGGHCRSVLDSILTSNKYHSIGIVDNLSCQNIMGIPVVGQDEDLPALYKQGWTHAFITLGSIGNPVIRRKLYQRVNDIGFSIPNIIDPSAIVSENVILDKGIFIGKRVIVNVNSHIGEGAILNSGCIIEHDCNIGDFVHISPGAVVCGHVQIDENSHLGAGAIVRQQLQIGRNSLIGAGSVVVRNIPEGKIAYGNPCRVVSNI